MQAVSGLYQHGFCAHHDKTPWGTTCSALLAGWHQWPLQQLQGRRVLYSQQAALLLRNTPMRTYCSTTNWSGGHNRGSRLLVQAATPPAFAADTPNHTCTSSHCHTPPSCGQLISWLRACRTCFSPRRSVAGAGAWPGHHMLTASMSPACIVFVSPATLALHQQRG
jgi:hypothetical protein